MRVLVNGLASAGARTGIGHYTSELVRCLRQLAGADAIRVFPPLWLAGVRSVWARCRPSKENAAPRSIPAASRAGQAPTSWKGRLMAALRSTGQAMLGNRFDAACRGCDLYHEPNVIPRPSDLPTVTTIHDLSVLLHPEWHPAERLREYEKHFAAGIVRCAHVLTVSEFARREIIDTLGLPPDRVSRAWNGVRPHLGPLPTEQVKEGLRALKLPPRYLLFLGTLEPRKNVRMLVQVYSSLPGWLRERYPLVLIGGRGWNSADIHTAIEEGRHKGVLHLGYVEDKHLATLYNGARCLVFPSFYEGFGLPPVEMLACGGAVLASTAGSIVEVVGHKAHLIDPHDRDGWRQALMRVATDEDWWRELRRGAEEVARPFTWERSAADTLAVYQRVLAGGRAKQPLAA
jgi:alpha-1,3-rhamnosyl/mannosyltransferase